MDVDYGASTTDNAAYVYDVRQSFAPIDAASSCPRIYSNELDLTYFPNPDSEAEAYPPTSYLMDPQKHELYMDPTRQQTFNPSSLAGSQLETIPPSTTQPDGDDLDRHMSLPPEQTSSPTSSEESECPKKNVTDVEKDGSPPSHSKKTKEEVDSEENEPYSQLIYRALKDAPENKMVLKEIYQWFMDHTDKSKNPSKKGWQNSIRHNLSMNGAFKKVEQDPASGDSKKGFVWVLEPSALSEGVKSTTRYRKPGPVKKSGRSDSPALQRQVSGRKGGQASRRVKCGKSKKSMTPAVIAELARIVEGTESSPNPYYGSGAISEQDDQLFELAARHSGRPLTLENTPCYPYYMPLTASPAASEQPLKLEESPYSIHDLVGVADSFPGDPLFCDGSELTVDPMMAGLSLHDPGPSPNF
ncbi:MAG: hypothetical protein M1816_002603 [Peltula sp. TS41687]|nr:MAG: hypothetical protein M1816_002603 [Peltula sp. TS41687]